MISVQQVKREKSHADCSLEEQIFSHIEGWVAKAGVGHINYFHISQQLPSINENFMLHLKPQT